MQILYKYVHCKYETNLGEISIPGEVEAGEVHIRESRVHVHVHICSGVGSAAVQVVLPGGKRRGLVSLVIFFNQYLSKTGTCGSVFFALIQYHKFLPSKNSSSLLIRSSSQEM